MAKQEWRPGNMLYPLPAVIVTCRDEEGRDNALTIAWTGTICSDPAMLSISVRHDRYSYDMIRKTGVFTVNLTTEDLAYATDYLGVKSGRDEDKLKTLGLELEEASHISCGMLKGAPVNIECRVKEAKDLGSHVMFLADVLAVHADEAYLDEKGRFSFEKCRPIVYSHGEYRALGRAIGHFGFSVRKKKGRR